MKMKSTLSTIALDILASVALTIVVLGSANAAPPGSCVPWPECNDGGGSGDTVAFSETCKNLKQWTVVTGNWTTSKGECLAKNTDTEHTMTTTADINLSGAFKAQLSYKFRINDAEYLLVSASDNGGSNFVDVTVYVGTQSGTISLNLADYVDLTDKIRLRASCLVSADDAICGWDNIKIETVTSPPGELVVTINSPQARTYRTKAFPLIYEVELSHEGTVEYSLDGDLRIEMTPDEGGSGTVHTSVQEVLAENTYSFEAFATAGNSYDTQTVEFQVDDQVPAIEFVAQTPPNGSNQTSPDIPVSLATNSGLDHYSFVDFDNDLYLWLSMEDVDGPKVIDASSYGNHGFVEGDAIQNPNGKFGSAFEFDGINHGGDIPTDRIVIPGFQDRHPMIFNNSFTVMAWARPNINEKMVIIGTKSITNLPGWHLRTSGGSHRLRMGVNTGYTSETAASAETSDPMEPGVWVHVVGIYDATEPAAIHLYLDGEWIDTKTDTDGVVSTGYGNDLELAIAVPEDPQKAWDGLVDEVLIFNRVLDAAEIKALYDSTANQFHKNYLGLDPGVHEFVGYSLNAAGNKNETEVRSVTIK